MAEPFGQSRPREIGLVGIALDLGDPAVLDVDELAAADGAVGTDRLDDAIGVRGAAASVAERGDCAVGPNQRASRSRS